ncbi:unnamed protein product [Arctia plantaginis]|uniref:SCP domain-containing protein n=1 Tax=Arctia plantaginis TaxID=874455 RepID=A0A8S0ZTS1_ARCPL|nr:unnamed protein product [Arctia plantaginis]
MLTTKKILFIGLSLQLVIKCTTKDYCSPVFCNNSRQHTLCKYQSEEPASTCLSYERTILNDNDRRQIVDKINNRRNKVAAGEIRSLPPAAGMMKLEWNMELEKSAQRWADQCVKHGDADLQDSCRDLGNVPVGQNIATVQGDSPGLTPLALVDVWYMELLKIDSSVISCFVPSSANGELHYDYFTQLIWEQTTEVGCGGVKFKDRLDDTKYRTIYRLVCNFSPAGNRRNKTVYSCGTPCSGCPDGVCDHHYTALCEHTPAANDHVTKQNYDEVISTKSDLILDVSTKSISVMTDPIFDGITFSTPDLNSENDSLMFTYFPHLPDHKMIRERITSFANEVTRSDALLDDFIELLKKKLSSDSLIKNFLLTTLPQSTEISDILNDEGVAAFINKVYSKKELPTTLKTTPKDYVNSTLLVDLIEAVIFRSNDKMASTEIYQQESQTIPVVKPIKVQAELAEVKQNRDFTGHYFFPEDDDESNKGPSESYYDNTDLAQADVEMEIDYLKMSSITRDFLDDIFESDTSTESTTTFNTHSPDKIPLYKNGYRFMKKFLKSIENKADS